MLKNIIQRTRRNHGLEHASIHMLSEKHKGFGVQGNSTHNGFYLNIYGDVPAEDIATAVHEALHRMKNGQEELALHPNCGTVLLTTATMATLTGQLVFSLEQKRQRRHQLDTMGFLNVLPTAVLGVVFALIASRPLGMYFQSYTTTGKMADLKIIDIKPINPSPITHFFRVLLGRNKRITTTSYFIATQS